MLSKSSSARWKSTISGCTLSLHSPSQSYPSTFSRRGQWPQHRPHLAVPSMTFKLASGDGVNKQRRQQRKSCMKWTLIWEGFKSSAGTRQKAFRSLASDLGSPWALVSQRRVRKAVITTVLISVLHIGPSELWKQLCVQWPKRALIKLSTTKWSLYSQWLQEVAAIQAAHGLLRSLLVKGVSAVLFRFWNKTLEKIMSQARKRKSFF